MYYLNHFFRGKKIWIIGLLLLSIYQTEAQIPIGLHMMDSLMIRASYYRANVRVDSSLYYYQQMTTRSLSAFETQLTRMDTTDTERYAIAYLRGVEGMAFCSSMAGEYEKSLMLINSGIDFYQSTRQSFYVVMANLLFQKAEVYILLNNYTMASKQYSLVLQGLVSVALHRSLSPTEIFLENRSLKEIGRMYYYQYKHKEAILFFENFRKRLYGNMLVHRDTSLLISTNIMLSDCYDLSEQMKESKQVLMEAAWLCSINMNASRSIQEQMITIYSNLGDLFRRELDYDVAFNYYLKAEKLAQDTYTFRNHNPDYYETETLFLISLGKVEILSSTNKYRKALDLAYISLSDTNLKKFNIDCTNMYSLMAYCYENLNLLDSAEYCARATLTQHDTTLKFSLRINLALILLKKGSVMKADLLIDTLLNTYHIDSSKPKGKYLNYDLNRSGIEYDYWSLIQSLKIKASILSHQEQYDEAFQVYKACLVWSDSLIYNAISYMHYRRYTELIHDVSQGAISLCLKLAKKEDAFLFLQKASSILSRHIKQVKLATEQAGIPSSLVQRRKELTSILQQYNILLNPNDQKLFFNYQSEYDSLTRIIQQHYPVYANLSKQILVTTPEQINTHLVTQHPHTAFSSFFCTDSITYQFLFTKNHFEILSIPIGADSLKRLVNDFQASICHPLTKGSELTTVKRTGEQLFRLLIAPAESLFHVQGIAINHWVIAPDQQLHYLSFSALIRPTAATTFKDLPYLIKDYRFTHTPSATLWISESKEESLLALKHSGLLTVVGYFDRKISSKKLTYRDMEPLLHSCGHPCQSLGTTIPVPDSVSIMRGNSLLPLNYALPQSDFSKKLFQSYRLPCIGIQDTFQMKKSLVQAIRNHPDHIIQFISHGKVNKNDPLRTCLYLYDTKYGRDSLTALEVMALSVRSRLVVFSACKTGVDRITDGEGMEGMVQAWRFAGARNILASLGEINDRATAAFMLYFYRQLLENPKQTLSLTLQKTQNHMIQSGYFTEPVFWAQFKLIGYE